jgi:hypothetical protein
MDAYQRLENDGPVFCEPVRNSSMFSTRARARQSPRQAAQARQALAGRRIMHPATAAAPRPCFGPTTLSRTVPMMDAGVACSTFSTSSPTNAWRSELLDDEIFFRYARRRSSSRVGGVTTTASRRTRPSATKHQHPRCLCPRSPRGRLRYLERLRWPR